MWGRGGLLLPHKREQKQASLRLLGASESWQKERKRVLTEERSILGLCWDVVLVQLCIFCIAISGQSHISAFCCVWTAHVRRPVLFRSLI